jgi:hypothetical protein
LNVHSPIAPGFEHSGLTHLDQQRFPLIALAIDRGEHLAFGRHCRVSHAALLLASRIVTMSERLAVATIMPV